MPMELNKAVNERNYDSMLNEIDSLTHAIEEENIFRKFEDGYHKKQNETATFFMFLHETNHELINVCSSDKGG